MHTLMLKMKSSKVYFFLKEQYHVIMINPVPIVLTLLIILVLLVAASGDNNIRDDVNSLRTQLEELEDKHYGMLEFIILMDT